MNDWKYKDHRLVCLVPPHEEVDTTPFETGEIWKGNKAIVAKWTSNFDCNTPTQWWYCIKDTPLDLAAMKAKKRYRITSALRAVDVRKIDPQQYIDALNEVRRLSFESYPKKNRPAYRPSNFRFREVPGRSVEFFACFEKGTDHLIAFSYLYVYKDWVSQPENKAIPAYEKLGTNVALMYAICNEYLNERKFRYISSGERNIRHITNYQKWLISNFDFRYAYCTLHVAYRPGIRPLVSLLYPFRKWVRALPFQAAYNLYALLYQEELHRTFGRKNPPAPQQEQSNQ